MSAVRGSDDPGTAPPSVAVVVLNWNGWQDTLECLESLSRLSCPRPRVIVVDNGSDDSSAERILEAAGGRITLVRNERNLGFAGGHNAGIRVALAGGARYVGLLNNDTLVTPGFLGPLLATLECDPSVGVVGPRILHPTDGMPTERPLRRRPGLVDLVLMLGAYNADRLPESSRMVRRLFSRATTPEAVYALPGSCLLFSAAALERIGLLDERTFLYFEELIAAERLARAGLRCVYVPEATIYHRRGRSTARLGARRFIEGYRSQRHYTEAYLGLPRWKRWVLDAIRIGVYLARSVTDASYRARLGELVRAARGRDLPLPPPA